MDLDRFYNNGFENEDFYYKRRIELLKKNFDNVICLDYDDFKTKQSFFVNFLASTVGDGSRGIDRNLESRKANIGIPIESYLGLALFNKFIRSAPRIMVVLLKKIRLYSFLESFFKKYYVSQNNANSIEIKLKDIGQQFKDDWEYFLSQKTEIKNSVDAQ